MPAPKLTTVHRSTTITLSDGSRVRFIAGGEYNLHQPDRAEWLERLEASECLLTVEERERREVEARVAAGRERERIAKAALDAAPDLEVPTPAEPPMAPLEEE